MSFKTSEGLAPAHVQTRVTALLVRAVDRTSSDAALLHVVLFEPEKAGNVGNVARTCAVLGAELHLIRPFGFHLHDREFRRAVMDYMEGVTLHEHASWTAFAADAAARRRGSSPSPRTPRTLHTRAGFRRGDYLLFGPESRGLPVWLREGLPRAEAAATRRGPQPESGGGSGRGGVRGRAADRGLVREGGKGIECLPEPDLISHWTLDLPDPDSPKRLRLRLSPDPHFATLKPSLPATPTCWCAWAWSDGWRQGPQRTGGRRPAGPPGARAPTGPGPRTCAWTTPISTWPSRCTRTASEAAVDFLPAWLSEESQHMVADGYAFISIVGERSLAAGRRESAAGGAAQQAAGRRPGQKVSEAIGSFQVNWTVAAMATPAWAARVYPDLPEAEAVARLWDDIFKVTRADTPDPVAAWDAHLAQLQAPDHPADRKAVPRPAPAQRTGHRSDGGAGRQPHLAGRGRGGQKRHLRRAQPAHR